MGGIGSGNRLQWTSKASINGFLSIDIRRWAREGFLNEGSRFGWQWSRDGEKNGDIGVSAHSHSVTLKYRSRVNGGEWTDYDYPVRLETTPCNFGGNRVWFRCPAQGCGRRVAKLYGGGVFACRTCHNASYPSQNETYGDRASRRAERIRKRLDWPESILDGSDWSRPKGMHLKTYDRLVAEHDYYANQSLGVMLNMLAKLETMSR